MNWSDRTKGPAVLFVVILLFAALFPFVGMIGGLTFGSDSHITYSGENRDQKEHDVASWGFGDSAEVYVVYEDYSTGINDGHILFQRSVNGGQTWAEPYDFMPADPVSGDRHKDPVIDVIDSGDGENKTIAVAYLDSTYREIPALTEWVIVVRTSTDGGITWSVNRVVTPISSPNYPSSKIKDIDMCFDPYGNIFVIWTNVDPANDQIDMSYSIDLGVSWSTVQGVKLQSGAPDPNWAQKKASVAATGQYVLVAWEVNYDYKPDTWMTRGDTSSLAGLPTIVFEDPWRIPKPVVYPMYQTYLPTMEADASTVHLTWWDFSTDSSGSNNGDVNKDRPCIKYTKSINNGATWTVGGQDNIIVNKSQTANKFHGRPDIGLGFDGTVSISWMDYTLGKPNIFTTVSTDSGETWEKPARVNDHDQDSYRDGPKVATDTGGDAHVVWWERENQQADMDIFHARTIVNQAPEIIDDLSLIVADERFAMVSWTPILEPDFKNYKTYISESQGFSPVDTAWPDGPLYNSSTNQLMNLELFNTHMVPNTFYYVKVTVTDQEGLISISNEIEFKTRPVNQPPVFTKDIPTIYMVEDESVEEALNLTYWVEMGWITDDSYNGFSALEFFIEAEFEESNLTARVRKVGLDTPYWYLDVFTSVQNWFGKETYRIGVRDTGKDGGHNTPDDKIGYSNWFTIQVNSTNDLPIWARFEDKTNGWQTLIEPHAKEVHLLKKDIGCIERQDYIFAITANDIDGDFLEFTTNMDDRITIKLDGQDPQHKSIFTILPTNDDVPELNITITASDKNGGLKNLTLYIPVFNVNNPPEFLKSNDVDELEPRMDRVEFSVYEKGTLRFNVTANDVDFGDVMTLTSPSDRPSIKKTGKIDENFTVFTEWTITIVANEQDAINGYIEFILFLRDLTKSDQSELFVNITILNIQDPPEWIVASGRITVDYVFDSEDINEWGNKKGGTKIQAEWGEEVLFEGFAKDRDDDALNYTWTITNDISGQNFTLYGKRVMVRFYPSNGNVSILQSEKFLINLTVSDEQTETVNIWYQIQQWLWSDDDNDNDGMPDKREKYFWNNLDHDPNVDEDGDGYTNIQEIGFQVPQYEEERKVPYTIRSNEVNPNDVNVYPGHPYTAPPDDPEGSEKEGLFDKIPPFLLVLIIAIVVIVLGIGISVLVVLRMSKKKDDEEDEELEKRVEEMERRQEELSGLYGVQKAGDAVGPDQSTLDDLSLDLGGQIYHEEGKQNIVKGDGSKIDDEDVEEKKTDGPAWESGTGPMFDESGAATLEFGEKMEVEAMSIDPSVTRVEAEDVDEDALSNSMDALMDAAEEYDEEAVKDAGGGNVLIGAVPMEEQIKQMQQHGQAPPQGPRTPPPGQAPPQAQQVPPGQAPPQMQRAPMQRGLPPAQPIKKRPPQE